MLNQTQPRRMVPAVEVLLVKDLDKEQWRNTGGDGEGDGVGIDPHQALGEHRVGVGRSAAPPEVGDKGHQGPTESEVHEDEVEKEGEDQEKVKEPWRTGQAGGIEGRNQVGVHRSPPAAPAASG